MATGIMDDLGDRAERNRQRATGGGPARATNAQSTATQRLAAERSGGRAGIMSRLGNSRAGGVAKTVGRAATAPATLATFAGSGALDSYNTPTGEQAKVFGLDEAAPSPDDSLAGKIGGFAKDSFIRGAGTGYQTAQNMGIVAALDSLPGTNLPRLEQGRYVPGDAVDEFTLRDAAGSIASGLSAANDGYRRLAGYNAPAQGQANGSPDGGRPASRESQSAPSAAASRGNRPDQTPTPSDRLSSSAGVAPQAGSATRSATAPQAGVAPQAGPGGRDAAAQGAEGRLTVGSGDEAAQRFNEATSIYARMEDNQRARSREVSDVRRQRTTDAAAGRAQTARNQMLRDVMGSIAYRNGDPETLRLAEQLTRGGGTPGIADDVRGEGITRSQAVQNERERLLAEADRLNLSQEQRNERGRRRVDALAQTDPEAAQALAVALGLREAADQGDRFVSGDQVITRDADGNALLEPITAQVTYDTRADRQFGGIADGMGGQPRGPGISRNEWIRQAMADPRNAGATQAQIERAFEDKYGS